MSEYQERIQRVNRTIHEPARFVIMSILYGAEGADFLYLQTQTGLTHGNLGTHLTRLEEAGLIQAERGFRGRVTHTIYRLTSEGRQEFDEYIEWLKEASASRPQQVESGSLLGQVSQLARRSRIGTSG
jgi:DNA-binding MarR family transcriptional regulator